MPPLAHTYMHLLTAVAQAIDALALCDVDGRMFLEMDEEDLAESDELGLDVGVYGSKLFGYSAHHHRRVPHCLDSCERARGYCTTAVLL